MYEFDIEMPSDYKTMLLQIVKFSKKEKSLTLDSSRYFMDPINENDSYQISMGDQSIISKAAGNPFQSFECYGFIKIFDINPNNGKYVFIVLSKAFEWADYQKMNVFRKWLRKLPSTIRDIGLFISFVLSIASFIWIIIQVMNNFN